MLTSMVCQPTLTIFRWPSHGLTLLCVLKTLVSAHITMKHAAELIIPGFCSPTLSLRDVRPGAGGWRYILEMGSLHLDRLSLNAPVVRCFLFG